jgi:hypothetical protein
MAPTSPSKMMCKSLSAQQIKNNKHKRASIILAAIGGAASAVTHALGFIDKECIHTSILTGRKWLDELLAGSK